MSGIAFGVAILAGFMTASAPLSRIVLHWLTVKSEMAGKPPERTARHRHDS